MEWDGIVNGTRWRRWVCRRRTACHRSVCSSHTRRGVSRRTWSNLLALLCRTDSAPELTACRHRTLSLTLPGSSTEFARRSWETAPCSCWGWCRSSWTSDSDRSPADQPHNINAYRMGVGVTAMHRSNVHYRPIGIQNIGLGNQLLS